MGSIQLRSWHRLTLAAVAGGGIIIGITTIKAQPKLETSNETRAQQQ
jgi:hypothetical protein